MPWTIENRSPIKPVQYTCSELSRVEFPEPPPVWLVRDYLLPRYCINWKLQRRDCLAKLDQRHSPSFIWSLDRGTFANGSSLGSPFLGPHSLHPAAAWDLDRILWCDCEPEACRDQCGAISLVSPQNDWGWQPSPMPWWVCFSPPCSQWIRESPLDLGKYLLFVERRIQIFVSQLESVIIRYSTEYRAMAKSLRIRPRPFYTPQCQTLTDYGSCNGLELIFCLTIHRASLIADMITVHLNIYLLLVL